LPPRIIANESADEKIDEPGSVVTVCLPALISRRRLLLRSGRADAEQAVLRLQPHFDAGRHVVGHQRRQADAEVHVEAVLQFLRRARGHLVTIPGHVSLLSRVRRVVRCVFRASRSARSAARRCRAVDLVGIERAVLDDLLDLGHGDLAGHRAHRVEVARGAAKIRLPDLSAFQALTSATSAVSDGSST
jgi:hypothetical protein